MTAEQKLKNGANMNISEAGLSLIKKFEGCALESYLCPAGVWTIGYGHTKDVKEGDKINNEEADHLLQEEMPEYEEYVKKYVTHPLEQHQFDALVCWTYNLGPNNLRNSTMLTVLNQGRLNDVSFEMQRWNKAGGEVLKGLVRRRKAESLLFQGKDWHEV